MDDRERAVVATHVVTAMKQCEPNRLEPLIDQLGVTPWDQDVVAVLKAVKHELERQKYASRGKHHPK